MAGRNLLAQQLGYSPGTALIGSFGSTEKRFRPLPLDGSPDPRNPSPAHYSLAAQAHPFAAAPRWPIASRRQPAPQPHPTPGPGAHELYAESAMLDGVRRRWPGQPGASGFSSNARRTPPAAAMSPGPGEYDVADASRFTSRARSAHSPCLAEARRRTGSKLARSADSAPSAPFASKSCARADAAADELPGPGSYSPYPPRAARGARGVGPPEGVGFDVSESRFTRLIGEPIHSELEPGPGSHNLLRWDGRGTSKRRVRHPPPPGTRDTGFNTRALREPPFAASSQPTDTEIGQAVVHFLANGPFGPPGSGCRRAKPGDLYVRVHKKG